MHPRRAWAFSLILLCAAAPRAGDIALPDSAGTPAEATPRPALPDLSGYDKADGLWNILFWVGQAKIPLLALTANQDWNIYPFMALYGLQQTGLGMNYYANRGYLRAFRDLGGEPSFLRAGAGTLYLADKALTLASVGAIAYGIAEDESDPVIMGGLGIVLSDLIDFYVWYQLRQSNNEARSAVVHWNAGVGIRDGGLSGKITYSFR